MCCFKHKKFIRKRVKRCKDVKKAVVFQAFVVQDDCDDFVPQVIIIKRKRKRKKCCCDWDEDW